MSTSDQRSDADRIASWLRAPSASRLDEHWPPDDEHDAFEVFYTSILRHNRVDAVQSLRAVDHLLSQSTSELDEVHRLRARRLRAHAFFILGRPEDSRAEYEAVWSAAEAAKLPKELIPTGIGMVLVLAHLGEYEQVHALSKRLQGVMGPEDGVARARLLSNEASVYHLTSQYERAAACFEGAWKSLKKAGLEFDAAVTAYNLAHSLLYGGNPRRARPRLNEALAVFSRGERTHQVLYVEFSLAVADMMEGKWDGLRPKLNELHDKLERLGDSRASAALLREQAEFLAALGALEPAEKMAFRAQCAYAEAGLNRDAAHTAFLHGRVLSSLERNIDARVQFVQAGEEFSALGDPLSRHRVDVELAGIYAKRGEHEIALSMLQESLDYLESKKSAPDVVKCKMLMAEALLASGQVDRGLQLAQGSFRAAKGYPARTERPWIALVAAKAQASRGKRGPSRRWLRRAVEELEQTQRDLRSAAPFVSATTQRRRFLDQSLELALEPGGAASLRTSLDLLSRIDGLELASDVLPADRQRWLAVIAGLRDRLLSTPSAKESASRIEALDSMLERSVAADESRLSAATGVMDTTPLASWLPRLDGAQLVYFHRVNDSWAAFVVDRRSKIRRIELPALEGALQSSWLPLRMLLDRAAHLEPGRRSSFLDRTLSEAEDALGRLREAMWQPLALEAVETIVIPTGALHGVPIEALALSDIGSAASGANPHIVSRLPHPAFLRRAKRGPLRRALLLHDGNSGPHAETERVRRVLDRAGVEVGVGSRRNDLTRRAENLDILHVAAHGSYHRQKWLLNGVRLSDGWLGFERLGEARLKNALLYFSSCESGLNHEAPGAELGGWSVAGLQAGAKELMLSLWKIDDEAAGHFSRSFYESWLAGSPAARAADDARRAVRGEMPHPFAWASFLNVG